MSPIANLCNKRYINSKYKYKKKLWRPHNNLLNSSKHNGFVIKSQNTQKTTQESLKLYLISSVQKMQK